MKNLSLFLVLILFVACASSIQSLSNQEREKITTRIYSHSYEDVFNACITRLENRGFILNNFDSKLGIITTEYKQTTDMLSRALVGNSRTKAMVRIKNLGENTKVIFTPQLQLEYYLNSWESVNLNTDMKPQFDRFFDGVEEILNE